MVGFPEGFILTRYRFLLQAKNHLSFAPSLGVSLRGAFGKWFKQVCCQDLEANCLKCSDREKCPYAQIFESSPPFGTERLSKNQNLPRPFVFKPPLNEKQFYQSRENISFDLVLFGKARDYLPYFILAFKELSKEGIGVGRRKFELVGVWAVGRKGLEVRGRIFPEQDQNISEEISSQTFIHEAGFFSTSRIKVKFLTPTYLVFNKRRITKPEFHHIFKRARDRINALSTFYAGKPLEMDFADAGKRSEKVKLVSARLTWEEHTRFSTKSKIRHPIGGVKGEAIYEGDFKEFLPLLLVGEEIHIGKHTSFGNGWIEIEPM